MTRIAPLADVKARLSAYIEESQTEGPVVITRNGKAVAVLISPVDDDDVESLVLARSPRLQRLLKKSRASIAAGRGLSSKEFWRTVLKRRRRKVRGNIAQSCRLVAGLKAQQPAKRSKELLISARRQNQ